MFEEMEGEGYARIQSDISVIHKRVVERGIWGAKPTENAVVKIIINDVKCSGILLQNIQESNTISQYLDTFFDGSITIGNADSVIDKALEQCIHTMLISEISRFIIRLPSVTNLQHEEYSTYPYAIECCIKLEELMNSEPVCEWTNDKIYRIALYHKAEGVKLFKSGRKIESFLRFSKSFKFLHIIKEKNYDLSSSLRVALLNNMANCQLEFQNYVYVITLCSKVLVIDPDNIKSLYRRAMAFINIQKFDEAKDDLQKILQIEPSNIKAKEKFSELKVIMKEKDANYAAVIKKMFSS